MAPLHLCYGAATQTCENLGRTARIRRRGPPGGFPQRMCGAAVPPARPATAPAVPAAPPHLPVR